MLKERISIVIPCRNEEKSIRDIITKCQRYADDIIVVDGHSTDGTREIAESMNVKVYLDNRKGKGDALRVGVSKALKEIIVFIDSDCSHDPDEIPKLVQPIIEGQADHVTGSRMRGGSDELHGDLGKFIRMVGSDIITLGINYRFGVGLTDSQNGFRAIKTEVARSLNLKENITTIEQEMIIKTLRKGYRMAEVPSHEYKRRYGDSTIKVSKVCFRYVYSWLKYLLWG
ncbi:MAG: glycosyltransferase family 2 protein [Planctomycetota bacterium]|jgi:dolichol-phosphate mannosyltransferase